MSGALTVLHRGPRATVYLERGARGAVVHKVLDVGEGSRWDLLRLDNELAISRDLAVPGVRRALRREELEGRPSLVLDYVEGQTLGALVARDPASVAECVRVGAELASALGRVHDRGVIHRDVKPDNAVLGGAGAVTLIDFGIAIRYDLRAPHPPSSDHIEGTFAYIAPEQTGRMNRGVDHRADLYSLGATLFELFTGRPPFVASDPAELLHAHIARTPTSPRDLNPLVPDVVAAIVLRLLAKDADARYQSAHAVARDLARCADALRGGGHVADFALSVDDSGGRFRVPQRLYGRDLERALLLDAFAQAAEGAPRVAWIEGGSGAGKSALVRELQRPVAERRGLFVEGKGEELHRASPYHAASQAMRALVEALLAEGDARLAERRAEVAAALGDLGGALLPLVPNLPALLGPLAPPPELTEEESRNRFLHLARAFFRAVCGPAQPLAVFLDDLQWVDGASLKLLEHLATDPSLVGLFVVGALRTGEGAAASVALALADRLDAAGVPLRRMVVAGLAPEHTRALLADTLDAAADDVAPLADAVHAKTHGNPFALGELLRTLHERRALAYDEAARRWRWDLAAALALEVSDSVAGLLAARLERLPPETQDALRWGACVGHRFTLGALAVVRETDVARVATDLIPAVEQGLLTPLDDARALVGAAAGEPCFDEVAVRFAHDRVQGAAYAGLDEGARAEAHLRVGRLLLAAVAPEDRAERIFDIANQFARALPRVTDPAERARVMRLNLDAGHAAMRSAAYPQAVGYLQAARALLGDDAWTRDYATALDLHGALAESCFMSGDHDGVAAAAAEVTRHARRPLDKVRAFESQLRDAAGRDELEDVVRVGLAALAELGEEFPAAPSMAHVGAALVRVKVSLLGKSVDALADAPALDDPRRVAALNLMERIAPAAFRTGSKLFPLLILRLVLLSVRHGCRPVSSFGYGGYALTLCGVLGDIEGGTRVGRMTLRLAERFGDDRYRGSARSVFEMFLRHWTEPLRNSYAPLVEAWSLGLATGRVFEAAWAGCYLAQWMFLAGEALAEVEATLERYAESNGRDEGARRMARLLQQVIANLRAGDATPWVVRGPHYDDAAELDRLARNPDKTELAFLRTWRLALAVWFRRTREALAEAAEAERHLEALTSMPLDPVLRWYAALARLAAAREGMLPRADALAAARKTSARFAKWAAHSPTNYEHKRLLLDAEVARTAGRPGARALYERAIAAARGRGFTQEEALASELAADAFREAGSAVLADMLQREATALWRRWGADAKGGLATAFAHPPRTSSPRLSTSRTTSPGATSQRVTAQRASLRTDRLSGIGASSEVDLQSLMKAAGAINAEIVMDRLAGRLLAIAAENAGAERAALLLATDAGVVLQATLEVGAERAELGREVPLEDAPVCDAVVRQVARLKQARVIDDALADPRLALTEHVRRRRVRSVLCAPIEHQGRLTGVLYLENNAAAGAFTPERVDVLRLLASQAAISLENARLYGSLERALKAQVRLNDAHKRFVPHEFLQNLGRGGIAEVQLGDSVQKVMTVLFSDVRGFTTLVEGMTPEENIQFINTYLRHMEPAIEGNRGFVDSYLGDAIMALFDEARNAVRAGVGMLRALRAFNEQRRADGRSEVRTGIGLSTGLLTMGTIGGENRIKCGVIGDPVNLAARVESLTKRYATPLLIGGPTREVVGDEFLVRLVDRVVVVGRSAPVALYEVYDADPEPLRDAKRAVDARYREALDHFYARRFADAERLFEECRGALGDDRVTLRFAARAARHAAEGVEERWTGVDELTEK